MSVKAKFTANRAGINSVARMPGVQAEIRHRAEQVQRLAQNIAPVRTGRYRASIHVTMTTRRGAAVAVITAGAPYSIYLERGTSRIRAQHVMRRALAAASR